MQISLRDIVDGFHVSEQTIRNWISKKDMPCVKVTGQYHFNPIALLEWTLNQRISLTPQILALGEAQDLEENFLYKAIKDGGIHYDVPGANRDEVLKSVVDLFPQTPRIQKKYLYDLLLSREKMMSTAIGNGIAIPHVRNPIVLHVSEPVISLCFLAKPVDFSALDGKPVTILFALLSPSVKKHLAILSRLAFCLQNPKLQGFLHKKESREKLLAEILILESKLKPAVPGEEKSSS